MSKWTKRWLERYWHPCRCSSRWPWHWHYGGCSMMRLYMPSLVDGDKCCCEILEGPDTLGPDTLRRRKLEFQRLNEDTNR